VPPSSAPVAPSSVTVGAAFAMPTDFESDPEPESSSLTLAETDSVR
jgi:hypothetical protein